MMKEEPAVIGESEPSSPRSTSSVATTLLSNAAAFCEETRANGEEYFGEGADNLTAIVVPV